MRRNITAFTNDPKRPEIVFTFVCQVRLFATFDPKNKKIHLRGTPYAIIEKDVAIVPSDEYRFKISEVLAKDGTNIEFDLRESDIAGRPGFILAVKNKRTVPGSYKDTITLRTDSAVRPEIRIKVYGKITDKNSKKSVAPFSEWMKEAKPKEKRE